MIHHPIVIGAKLALLLVILLVLVVLHGILLPEQFRISLFFAGGFFLIGVVAIWIFAFKVLCNPNSRLGGQLILSHQARTGDGLTSSTNSSQDMVGQRGSALSSLRPSGTARFGDQRISVVTAGEFIAKDALVEIVSAEGFRVVVRPAPPSESG